MHADGGWGYAPVQAPQLEPSCLGLLALALEPDRHADAIKKTRDFIERNADADGSYRPLLGRSEAVWPTSLVLFVKAALSPGTANPELERTSSYLLAMRG